jgi:hypothetical protein
MLLDQTAPQKKLIGGNAGSPGQDRSVAQGLGRVSVMGQEADLDRQNG